MKTSMDNSRRFADKGINRGAGYSSLKNLSAARDKYVKSFYSGARRSDSTLQEQPLPVQEMKPSIIEIIEMGWTSHHACST